MLPWAIDGLPGDDNDKPASQAPQLAQQPLTGLGGGETDPRDPPGHPVLDGCADRRRPDRHLGEGPGQEVRRLVGPLVRGRDAGRRRPRRPRLRAAPSPSSSAAPPRCRSRSPARPGAAPTAAAPKAPAKPGLGYVPANVEQPFAQNINAVLISPPQAPVDTLPLPSAVTLPGQPPNIISRAQWGADEAMRCGNTVYDNGIRAAVVHHTAGSNDYAPAGFGGHRPVDLRVPHPHAGLVRHRLQRAGRQVRPGLRGPRGRHGQTGRGRRTPAASTATPGAWRCSATSTSCRRHRSSCAPSARLLGWRLGLDHVDPRGTVVLPSAGGSFTKFPTGATPTLPTIFTHRDVGNTDCPGNAAYAVMDQIRDIAARFNDPPGPEDLADSLRGGAIFADGSRWAG